MTTYTGERAPYLQGKHHSWVFSEEDVEAFIRGYPWLIWVDRMREHYFWGLVREEWDDLEETPPPTDPNLVTMLDLFRALNERVVEGEVRELDS